MSTPKTLKSDSASSIDKKIEDFTPKKKEKKTKEPESPMSLTRSQELLESPSNSVTSNGSFKELKLEILALKKEEEGSKPRDKKALALKANPDSATHTDEEDNNEDDDLDDSYVSADYQIAIDKIKKEKERLKKEEEKLRNDELQQKKKAKEQIRKEKERLKKETEETLRKVKEEKKRETQKLYRQDEDMEAGWIKMRTPFKSWNLRYFVLVPGKLIYYRDEFEKDCMGIIVLNDCEVAVRKSKKDGFCFKITHPTGANIYSSKGLKGEALASGMVPVSADHCILRVNTEDERSRWIAKIADSIKRTNTTRRSSTSKPSEFDENDFERFEDTDENSHTMLGVQSQDSNSNVTSNNSGVFPKPKEIDSSANNMISVSSAPSVPTPASEPQDNTQNSQLSIKSQPKKQKKQRESVYLPSGNVDDNFDENNANEETLDSSSTSLIMMLLKQVRIGMDLSRVVLPTFILEPRSMLEKVSDFMTHSELLDLVPKIQDPAQRLIGILKWYVSGFYIKPKGVKKPFNPILGEFFRCMWQKNDSRAFYVGEQVSHHPPISAFYASNRKVGYVINGSILFRSKFLGTSAASILDGFAVIYITPFDEEYEITFPSAHAKGFLFGTLLMELVGPVHVICRKTGFSAELEFKAKPVIGGEYNVLHAKVKHDNETLYTIKGKWDGRVEIKNTTTKETEVLWEPTPDNRKNKAPKYKPSLDTMKDYESDKLWKKVAEAIHRGDQNDATEQKTILEQAQREAAKKRQQLGIEYKPRLFRKDESGIWVYKYANRSPFNPDVETEEYEYDGVIRSKLKNEEFSSDESEDEGEVNPLVVEAVVPKIDQPNSIGSSETALVARDTNNNNSNTTNTVATATGSPVINSQWQNNVEKRLLAVEKTLVMLQSKNGATTQPTKKMGGSLLNNVILFLIVVIIARLYQKGNL